MHYTDRLHCQLAKIVLMFFLQTPHF